MGKNIIMKLSFKRITSTGSFIPEIDGLRFIAIISVVLFHLSLFTTYKDVHIYKDSIDYSVLKNILSHGKLGVPLFFIISGFILGLPFAKSYFENRDSINLKSYFSRRLTRLEPPYVLVMILLFIGAVYVVKNLEFNEAVKSLFASLTYTHNFFYPGEYPLLNVSAWSLEVEVQFYILAPIIAYVFSIKDIHKRRGIIIVAIIFLIIFNHSYSLEFISLINYLHHFLVGFLLVDIFLNKKMLFKKTKFDFTIAIILFCIIWIFDSKDFEEIYLKILWELIQISCIFFFYYFVLIHKTFKFLKTPIITNIGGMCYSIYLLHYAIISVFGNVIFKYQFSTFSFLNVGIYIAILTLVVISISSIFFLLIEKPCMDKNWVNNLFKKNKIII